MAVYRGSRIGSAIDHPARKDLEALADRLANLVNTATVVSREEAIFLGLHRETDDLDGKSLDPDHVIDLLLKALGILPHGTGDIRLEADRLGDGTGIDIRLEVTPAASDRGNSADHSYAVTAAGRPIASSPGSGSLGLHDDPGDYKDLRKAISTALATHHRETFEIRIVLDVR